MHGHLPHAGPPAPRSDIPYGRFRGNAYSLIWAARERGARSNARIIACAGENEFRRRRGIDAPRKRLDSFFVRTWGLLVGVLFFSVSTCPSCASKPTNPSKYPERHAGCDVQIFPEEPSYPTDNIGPVHATCDESVSDTECLRELSDQACKLGADTIWGVDDTPSRQGGKKRFSGRAVHRKD